MFARLLLALLLGWVAVVQAQDQIRLKSGEIKSGTDIKFDEVMQSLTFKFDQGTLSYAQADLAEVTLQERAGVAEGRKALQDGKMEEVVGKWREPVNQFLGVDNPWVLECAGGLGQAYLALGRVADAESLYVRMKKAYPSGPAALRAEVGLAVATSGKDAAGLLLKLQALEKDLKESLRPLRADREALAEFYFARGEALEKKGDEKKALEDYLRVSILYPDPPSLGLRSAKKAEALRQANKDLVTE
jgi:tetratricopeptide (TPR) repeat protein